ncbi:MAG: HK97-gp10 family putative phage morphogenesis protein [Gammaproteobacteria bacterium]
MDANARREIDRAVQRLLTQVGDAVTADARRFVPVDTGKLRDSIERGPVRDDTVTVHARTDYAVFVEMGTRRMSAQAFLRPALFRKRAL